MRHRVVRRRPGRRLRLQSLVREDLLDHRALQKFRDDLQFAPAVRAVLEVALKDEPDGKGKLGS